MKELEKIQVFADGRTSPEVNSGVPILLIQDGIVQVGRIHLGEAYDFNMEIEHPINQSKLDPIATKIIKSEQPEYLKSKVSIIVFCPEKISDMMKWD
ncbi:hypothetical protein SAMN04489724_2458 [Algoriphagus locisalis]|uniref:Uncharacterized protein n=1 Tax=Algoriphagus locisalis TaxID=305507 RepID=A0A1I7BIQ4_9BACT|nr:hypothetical protein [Algoriphagus locisalis]SFT87032.1 hypothetical protein SAMN04489724_2458 [Algoriphagus locisalis]